MVMTEIAKGHVGPTYAMDKSFEWNAHHGPSFSGSYPSLPNTATKDFFGHAVNSRFGLAASFGTTAQWIKLYARLGFDILTYKTVRKQERVAHAWPNFFFLKDGRAITPNKLQVVAEAEPIDPSQATAAGSVGMPSLSPAFWRDDIRRCRAVLRRGQVLIVSIVATTRPDMSSDAFVAEFEELASEVREAGADIVEANLSCPNVDRREGEVYQDAEFSGRIAAAVRRGARDKPVLVKSGEFPDVDTLARFLRAIDGHANGAVLINAPSRQIVTEAGLDAFGPSRRRAGVMGGAIFDIALVNVRRAAAIISDDQLSLKLVAVGGASNLTRVRTFLDSGACAALAAWPAAWNPYLASEIRNADSTI